MATSEQLHLRALRLLHDGLPHSDQAIRWAEVVTQQQYPDEHPRADLPIDPALRGFTLRELSLGATPW